MAGKERGGIMWAKKNILTFAVLLLSFYVYAQDFTPADQLDQKLTNLSLNIQLQLSEAKMHSANLLESLTGLKQDLTLSNEQRNYYQEISNELENSLQNTIQSCASLSQDLNQSRQDLAAEKAIVRVMMVIAGIIILAKIAAFMLYAFHVPVPRWLDIIL
jgi:septal ring factor EnvC (AmiA/AmiB activator)